MSVRDWRTTARRTTFSMAAAVVASVAGFFLIPLWLSVTFDAPPAWTILLLAVVGALTGGSIWLARRSRIGLAWLALPLSAAVASGILGCVAWLVSVWEPMD